MRFRVKRNSSNPDVHLLQVVSDVNQGDSGDAFHARQTQKLQPSSPTASMSILLEKTPSDRRPTEFRRFKCQVERNTATISCPRFNNKTPCPFRGARQRLEMSTNYTRGKAITK
ncbi:hypothetical protein F2P81_013636 [Scophthalmus maximus]|uniref:Uncharacterized protein n=1 Tax=Scophthalmus maximus TaxID=52904 RepID=A0A6A4SNS1_SCOMX|nr:hypothetical protein F2P81_013636 [Scophthalmus maximus]